MNPQPVGFSSDLVLDPAGRPGYELGNEIGAFFGPAIPPRARYPSTRASYAPDLHSFEATRPLKSSFSISSSSENSYPKRFSSSRTPSMAAL